MVEQKHFRSDEPDNESYDQDFASPRPYAFGRSAFNGYGSGESVPLFLSDPDGEPDPGEYANPLRRHRRASISLRILMGTVAASAVAVLFAWFTSDATRDVLISAKASISTILPIPSAAAQPEVAAQPEAPAQLTAHDVQLKDPARWSAPGASNVQAASAPAAIAPPANTQSGPVVAMAPTREDISSAYQSALQGRAAAPAAAVAATPPSAATPQADAPPARHLDPDEVALLMRRAKDLLSTGDIPAARLLLRRAADAQEPLAALMLAQSYDPDMLGTQDVRNINPDPAMARSWYAKAAQLGSADAQRRLAEMQN